MIKFFRNIRKSLLTENRFNKYLVYAIGEIVLVVIGILIALQINIWNESRKNKENIERILKEIQQDLLNDIQEFGLGYEWAKRVDSLNNLIIKKQINLKELNDNELSEIYNLGRRDYLLKLSDASYKLLVNQKDKIPNEYEGILRNLNSIYEEDSFFLSDKQNVISNFTQENDRKIHDNFDWILNTRNGKVDSTATSYILSTENRKQLMRFISLQNGKWDYVFRIRDKSVFCYLAIRHLLAQQGNLPKVLVDYGAPEKPSQNTYNQIFEYVNSDNEASYLLISKEYGQIVWQNLDEKANFYFKNILLKELKKDSLQFIAFPNYSLKFFRNSENKITHARGYTDGKPSIIYKAVNND